MKFSMFEKTAKDSKYQHDPYRAVNFKTDEDGNPVCPNGKKFSFLRNKPICGNRYGRTEELYICEDCTGCPRRSKCYKGKKNQRVIRLNRELTQIHAEVLENLESIQGALLRMNRSIQAEGSFALWKEDGSFRQFLCRGQANVYAESVLMAIAQNIDNLHRRIQNGKLGMHLYEV